MPATTFADVKADVAAALQVPTTLPATWDQLINASIADAYNDLITILTLKGYSGQTALRADQFATWQRRLATYFTLTRGAAYAGFDVKTVEWMDPRKMLSEAAAILVDGVPTAPEPGESAVGGIESGQLDGVRCGLREYNTWWDGGGGRYGY